MTIRTIERTNTYLGILAAITAEREAKEIADSLNPPVAATRVWDSKKGCTVYATHYFGDVRVEYKRTRSAIMIGFKY